MNHDSDTANRSVRGAAPRSHGGDPIIRSRDNQWIKRFRAALRDAPNPLRPAGHGRNSGDARSGAKTGIEIAVEGPHLVGEALRAAATGGLLIETILVDTRGNRHLDVFAETSRHFGGESGLPTREGIGNPIAPAPRVLRTTDQIFRSIAATETPQGIAALLRLREYSLDELFGRALSIDGRGNTKTAGAMSQEKSIQNQPAAIPNLLLVVLVGVQDPGNVGAAIRSAEAFGATGLIATMGAAHPWSQKALRASAGSALRLPIVAGVTVESMLAGIRRIRPNNAISRAKNHASPVGGPSEALHHAAPQIFAACVHPPAGCVTATPEDTDLRGPVALLIGNEGAGLDETILRAADSLIRIPLAAPVESLNAGVAASLLLYEAARQRALLFTQSSIARKKPS